MSPLDKLFSLGAFAVAGEVIWKQKSMGRLVNGDFLLSEEGKAVLAQDITDVSFVDKPTRGRPKKVADPVEEIDLPSLD